MTLFRILLILIVSWSMIGQAGADMTFFDLTHEIPTFKPKPSPDGATRPLPDLLQPIKHSTPIAGFYPQAVLYPGDKFYTSDGYFLSRAIVIEEHNGTHLDSTNHYINNAASLEPGSNPNDQRKSAEQLTIEQLTGKIVLIDVSERVKKELAKNKGIPSPDILVTDFSNTSQATVRASDIESVADQIKDGVWVIARVGWDKFYYDGIEDWATSSYVNNFNHPGFTPEAIEKLIEIMDRKKVKISGIAADSWSTDSGEGAKGIDDNYTKAWQVHVRLYQRNILVVESLASLKELANAYRKNDDCYLMVGGLKQVGGTGGPARVMAACK
ncbi:MAG: cyclase family protein [Thiohalomonadales bacterium]